MASRKPAELVAVETFATDLDGEAIVVHAGDVLDAGHPLVKGRENLFAPRLRSGRPAAEPPAPKRAA